MNKCFDCKYKHKGNEEIPCCSCAYNHDAREDFYTKDDTPKTDKDFDLEYKEQEEQRNIDKQEAEGEPDYADPIEMNNILMGEIEEQIANNKTDKLNETLEELEK
jgi:hypothetical protein